MEMLHTDLCADSHKTTNLVAKKFHFRSKWSHMSSGKLLPPLSYTIFFCLECPVATLAATCSESVLWLVLLGVTSIETINGPWINDLTIGRLLDYHPLSVKPTSVQSEHSRDFSIGLPPINPTLGHWQIQVLCVWSAKLMKQWNGKGNI